jgi:Spy/CpxP family protein refolding chaperone
MRKLMIAILAVALLATSGLAMAQGWGGGPGMGRGPGMGMGYGAGDPGYGPRGQGYGPGAWGAALNLTPEQTQKLQGLRDGFFKETIPLRNEMMVKKLELRTLWAQTKPEQEKILAKQKEINALRAQMQEKSTKFRLEARSNLTPEQQAQVGSFWAEIGRAHV